MGIRVVKGRDAIDGVRAVKGVVAACVSKGIGRVRPRAKRVDGISQRADVIVRRIHGSGGTENRRGRIAGQNITDINDIVRV